MSNRLYLNLYKSLFFLSLLFSLFACDKQKKLHENIDAGQVSFLITLPSTAIAQFVVKCTNYDIILDSVIFLSPENTVYIEVFNSDSLKKDETFLAGSWLAEDGLWILNFKGKTQLSKEVFSSSVPYIMNIDNDDDEQ